jgi:hypothetical protein
MISENNRHNTETEFILVLGLPRSARASRLPTSSNQELDTTPSLLNQELSFVQNCNHISKLKKYVFKCLVYNCTRNARFAYLKQAAKPNFAAFGLNDGS